MINITTDIHFVHWITMYGSTGILRRPLVAGDSVNHEPDEPAAMYLQQRSVASSSQSTPREEDSDASSVSSTENDKPKQMPFSSSASVATQESDYDALVQLGLAPSKHTQKDRSASPPQLVQQSSSGRGGGGKPVARRRFLDDDDDDDDEAKDEFRHLDLAFILHVETLAREIAGNLSRKIGQIVTASFARFLQHNRTKLRTFDLANRRLPPYDMNTSVAENHELTLKQLKYMIQEAPLATITSCLSDFRQMQQSRASSFRFYDVMIDSAHRTTFARWVARLMELSDMLAGRTWRKDMLILANNQDASLCVTYFVSLR